MGREIWYMPKDHSGKLCVFDGHDCSKTTLFLYVIKFFFKVCILKDKLLVNFVAGGAQMELLLTRITW
jgi:hypothetical protein